MENISQTDNVNIKKYCMKLINGKYICQYNESMRDDYREMCNFFDIISNRLDAVGYQVIKNDDKKVIYLNSLQDIGAKKYNLKIVKSKILLNLIKYYFTNIINIENTEVIYYKWNNLLGDVEDIAKSKKEKEEIINSLFFFKEMGVIDISANKKDLYTENENNDIIITIYPSIQCVCGLQDLQEVKEKIESYNTTKNTDDIITEEPNVNEETEDIDDD